MEKEISTKKLEHALDMGMAVLVEKKLSLIGYDSKKLNKTRAFIADVLQAYREIQEDN